MSGGHFDYDQYRIGRIKEDIRNLIETNSQTDEWGGCRNYSKEILQEFEKAIKFLDLAYIYAVRIDYLVSGDDYEESFLDRLKSDLDNLNNEQNE